MRHIAQDPLTQRNLLQILDIPAQGDLLVRAAINVFEQEMRQPPPRGLAEIVDIGDDHAGTLIAARQPSR